MSPRPSFTVGLATAFFVTACGDSAPVDDDAHGHGHHDHDNAPEKEAHDHDDAHGHGGQDHDQAPASDKPTPFMLGSHKATLTPTGDGVRLQLTAADGSAVAPAGVARMVLTGTGEEQQRVELSPDGGTWVGKAKASGAAGYVAVVSVELDGHKQSGKVSWGTVPETKSAPKAAEAPHGDEGAAHGHQHGH